MAPEDKTDQSATGVVDRPPDSDEVHAPDRRPRAEPGTGDAAVRLMADQPKSATPEDHQDALEWFMADDESEGDPVYPIEINVSTDVGSPSWITWVVKPIASQRIDALRRIFQVPVNREQRRRGQAQDLDAAKFNAALVFEATVSPDLQIPINQGKFADGASLVIHRFRHKPLMVDQIAGQILFYSGGDDDDMRVAREVRAAGNS